MPLIHSDISSTAVTNASHSKLFSISFCDIRGLSCNLNSVHQHLQSSSPHVLLLTKTKIKPLDPNDNSILCPHLKCPEYEFSSSLFQNGDVCAVICSDVQSSHLSQIGLVNTVFNSSGLKFPYLTLQNSLAPYTAYLTQLIMNFYLTIYLRQLTQLLFNLHALKSPSLVMSMCAIRTGFPNLLISIALLVVMQRHLPF